MIAANRRSADLWPLLTACHAKFLAAHRRVDEIYGAITKLVPFPHQGHRRPDLTGHPIRFKRVRDYLIAYAPDEKPLWVIAVLHGHRSPRIMAAILRGME